MHENRNNKVDSCEVETIRHQGIISNVDERFNYGYNMGQPEKVILDYFYLRPGITDLGESRLRTEPEDFDARRFLEYSSHYNQRVQKLAELYLEKNPGLSTVAG